MSAQATTTVGKLPVTIYRNGVEVETKLLDDPRLAFIEHFNKFGALTGLTAELPKETEDWQA